MAAYQNPAMMAMAYRERFSRVVVLKRKAEEVESANVAMNEPAMVAALDRAETAIRQAAAKIEGRPWKK